MISLHSMRFSCGGSDQNEERRWVICRSGPVGDRRKEGRERVGRSPPGASQIRKFRNTFVGWSADAVPALWAAARSAVETIPVVAFRFGHADWLSTSTTTTFHQMSFPPAVVPTRWS